MKCWITTGLVAVAMMVLTGCTRTMTAEDTRKRENSVLASAHVTPDVTPQQQQVRATLAAVIQAAVTENGLLELGRHLSSASFDSSSLANPAPELNAAITRFRAQWKALYGQDFYLSDCHPLLLADATIHVDEPAERAQLAAHRIGAGDTAVQVKVPAFMNAPSVSLDLVRSNPTDTNPNSASTYRLRLPNSSGAAPLKQNLTRCLQALSVNEMLWPENAAAAERMVAQRILAALETPSDVTTSH